MQAYFTVDVEKDIHTGKYEGIKKGLPDLLQILRKHRIKATFFITGEVISKLPKEIKKISKEGHELGLHGYSHKRFDFMDFKEKEEEIAKGIEAYKKIFKKNPKVFRAPQHSIDKDTFFLLSKNGFSHDSSVCSGNIMLLRHLLKKDSDKLEIIRSFFGKRSSYKAMGMTEVPRFSPILSLGGFELKAYPGWLISSILKAHKRLNIPLNFVMHSWDMIDIKQSRTSKYCSAYEFRKRLDSFIALAKKEFDFKTIGNVK